MNYEGLGVLVGRVVGDEETPRAIRGAVGKRIVRAELYDDGDIDELRLWFTDDTAIRIFDDGQSCCEYRYMTTDDDPTAFVGALLENVRVQEGPDVEDERGNAHEVEFLIVDTSLGSFTLETHNEHNGYYGGFLVVARPLVEVV